MTNGMMCSDWCSTCARFATYHDAPGFNGDNIWRVHQRHMARRLRYGADGFVSVSLTSRRPRRAVDTPETTA